MALAVTCIFMHDNDDVCVQSSWMYKPFVGWDEIRPRVGIRFEE